MSAPKRGVAKRGKAEDRQPSQQFTVAELFCGCGGLSHGFARSGHFRVVLGNDIKKAALRTFIHNHSRNQAAPECLEGDIWGSVAKCRCGRECPRRCPGLDVKRVGV
jgi:site-specific DNA-cytosine methylase